MVRYNEADPGNRTGQRYFRRVGAMVRTFGTPAGSPPPDRHWVLAGGVVGEPPTERPRSGEFRGGHRRCDVTGSRPLIGRAAPWAGSIVTVKDRVAAPAAPCSASSALSPDRNRRCKLRQDRRGCARSVSSAAWQSAHRWVTFAATGTGLHCRADQSPGDLSW